eukprot:GHVL01023254.1.p1 GENE.GHVL01023254.1~~GHVL01023254.1.p1  ORF type:complete len:502 (+),score=52.77 GHVL01023254.1:951-2456(+)
MAALTDDNELHCIQISSNKIVHSQTLIGWSSDKRWIYSEEDPLGSSFVVSATEIVLIRKSDVFDAAHWLANKNRLNQARAFASKGGSETEKHVLNSCLKRLFKEKKMQLAANVIRHLKLEREEWKVCILAFDREKTLPELTNCLDIEQTDVGDLLVRLIERYPTVAKEAIKKWKNYTNVSVLIDVVFAQMSICEKPILWTIAGVVLEVTDKIEEAFKCYIKSQSMEVFDFINRYMNHLESHNKISDSLICQIIDHLTDLIEIDYEESMSIILNPLLEKSAHQIVRMLCNKNNFNRHIDQFLLTFVSKMSSKSPLILESFKLEYPLLYRFAVMAERRPPPYSEFSPFDELLSNDNKSTSLVKILLNDICDCSSALKLAAKHIELWPEFVSFVRMHPPLICQTFVCALRIRHNHSDSVVEGRNKLSLPDVTECRKFFESLSLRDFARIPCTTIFFVKLLRRISDDMKYQNVCLSLINMDRQILSQAYVTQLLRGTITNSSRSG